MVDLEALAGWLKERGVEEYFHFGDIDRAPEKQHNLYCLTERPGLGLQTENALDRPGLQVMVRGAGAITARDMMERVDQLLVDAELPTRIGGLHVPYIGRFGEPGYVGRDDKNRVAYSGNYVISIERG